MATFTIYHHISQSPRIEFDGIGTLDNENRLLAISDNLEIRGKYEKRLVHSTRPYVRIGRWIYKRGEDIIKIEKYHKGFAHGEWKIIEDGKITTETWNMGFLKKKLTPDTTIRYTEQEIHPSITSTTNNSEFMEITVDDPYSLTTLFINRREIHLSDTEREELFWGIPVCKIILSPPRISECITTNYRFTFAGDTTIMTHRRDVYVCKDLVPVSECKCGKHTIRNYEGLDICVKNSILVSKNGEKYNAILQMIKSSIPKPCIESEEKEPFI